MPKKSDHVEDLDDPQYDTPEAPPVPGDPGFNWVKEYGTDDLYTHTFPNGKVVALKSMKAIYSRTWMVKIRNVESELQLSVVALERAACPAAWEVLDQLDDSDSDPIDELWQAYRKSGTSRDDEDEGLTAGN